MRMRSAKKNLFDYLNYGFFIIFSLSVLYPFWYMLVLSVSTPGDVYGNVFKIIPTSFILDSYRIVLTGSNILVGYYNTILRAAAGTLLMIVVTMGMAYPLTRKDLLFRNGITMYMVFTMFFGGGLIPSYLLMKSLNLIDSRWALILPGMANVFNAVIVRNYMMSNISRNLEESAEIDGANFPGILTRIVFPLCKPVIATISLWSIVGHWNAWFDAMIYINSPGKEVLQIMLRKILILYQVDELRKFATLSGSSMSATVPESVKSAFMFIAIGPIILAYPFLQKYFVKGIMIGSLKG